ncbi:hypothetical protein [Actinokineospora sp.]|uniref:hypothetical protein n=1 Tax=Actinokineospora sp. TaxID=1872133 RepID=UPI00403837BF
MTTTVARRARKSPAIAPPEPIAVDAAVAPPTPAGIDACTTAEVRVDSAPVPPPLDAQGAPAAGIAAGWVLNRTITHLWSYDATTGGWVWVDGIGWKRLSPASESGHSHMTMLATMATHDNLAVDYHEDASGRIDQMLV